MCFLALKSEKMSNLHVSYSQNILYSEREVRRCSTHLFFLNEVYIIFIT